MSENETLSIACRDVRADVKSTTKNPPTTHHHHTTTQPHPTAGHPKNKVMVITKGKTKNLFRSFKNIQNVQLKRADIVNAYDVVSVDHLLLTKQALQTLTERLKK